VFGKLVLVPEEPHRCARVGPPHIHPERRREHVPGSVYRVTEVIGVIDESWEAAARNAVETAARTVRDLRVAEVSRQDVTTRGRPRRQLPRPSRDLVQVRVR
jgi:flavin-binding protein dodecin